jgi:dTDP-4-dehydrorhamnose reductase
MIAVFGGGGQVARELTRLCAERGVAARAFMRAETDIADAHGVSRALAAARPSVVVNAAAYTKVDKAESEIEEATRANAAGPAVLAEACANAGVPLVHLSTDYVFDGMKQGAYVESDPTGPLGVYGRTKLGGEEAIRARHPEHVILRTSWVFGAFGHNILKTVLRLAGEKDELRFVADQRGCPTATADIAEAILRIAARLAARDPVCGTYHLAGTGAATWFEFVDRVIEAQAPFTGRRPRVIPITAAEYPTPAKRPANSVLDSSRFIRVFGFRAKPWEERVDEVVRQLLGPVEPARTEITAREQRRG